MKKKKELFKLKNLKKMDGNDIQDRLVELSYNEQIRLLKILLSSELFEVECCFYEEIGKIDKNKPENELTDKDITLSEVHKFHKDKKWFKDYKRRILKAKINESKLIKIDETKYKRKFGSEDKKFYELISLSKIIKI